jgi:hypothetical protein
MLLKASFDFTPLNQFPELERFKKKYEGRFFYWSWVLTDGINTNLGVAVQVDMYRLACANFFEDRQTESKVQRRKMYREEIKEMYNNNIPDCNNLNSILLSYFTTYKGAEKLLNDRTNPDVGILVHQNIITNDDLQILMLPLDLFLQNYLLMIQQGKSFIDFV